jgi:hypothetical protein
MPTPEYYQTHKQQTKERVEKWRRENVIKYNAGLRTWRKDNPEKSRALDLKRRFGISIAEYNEILEKQNGCCAICGIHQSKLNKSLFVDHNHKTGKIRGLLCFKCNISLGHLEDVLQNAVNYIRQAVKRP